MGIPLLIFFDLIPVPKILILILLAGFCGYQLWHDPTFSRGIFQRESNNEVTKDILVRVLFIIPSLWALIWIFQPSQLLAFPANRPALWMVVIVLYPILSALPQEFIYRTYFFHRYGDLMSLKYSAVIASAAAFSFVHIIYDNWWAVGLSFVAGLLLGITYQRTKSLFWVTVEHAIYGALVFTLGMGNCFYEPF